MIKQLSSHTLSMDEGNKKALHRKALRWRGKKAIKLCQKKMHRLNVHGMK